MGIIQILIISFAVGLDAFGVAVSLGITGVKTRKSKLLFSLSFGFFQFLFAFLGGFTGEVFTTHVAIIPKVIGGIVISIVGVLMIKEGFEERNEKIKIENKLYIILGISVSIDSLIIGFTLFGTLKSIILLRYTLIIGIVAFIMTIIAFVLSKYLKNIPIINRYANYIGGVIMFFFGMKMMFS